jgi:hypothetical protein
MPSQLRMPFLVVKHAANPRAFALGTQRRNGFHVRRVVWGRAMARAEKRDTEEIRKATILVEYKTKQRTRR